MPRTPTLRITFLSSGIEYKFKKYLQYFWTRDVNEVSMDPRVNKDFRHLRIVGVEI